MRLLFILVLIVAGFNSYSQEELNRFDENGKRHGLWKKYYEGTRQVRYTGTFDHGKEVGVFKFYCEECGDSPMVIKTFSNMDSSAWVQYFTIKGKLVSEGKMEGRNRTGEWLYYQEKSNDVMTREFYSSGKLTGVKTTYYTNGQVTQETEYQNGLRNGFDRFYSPEGVLIKKLNYRNDLLDGPALYYDSNGSVVIEGSYSKGEKKGLWRYYENGILTEELIFPLTGRN